VKSGQFLTLTLAPMSSPIRAPDDHRGASIWRSKSAAKTLRGLKSNLQSAPSGIPICGPSSSRCVCGCDGALESRRTDALQHQSPRWGTIATAHAARVPPCCSTCPARQRQPPGGRVTGLHVERAPHSGRPQGGRSAGDPTGRATGATHGRTLDYKSATAEASPSYICGGWPVSPSQDIASEKRRLGLHELTSERALAALRACLARWRTGGWLGLLVRPTLLHALLARAKYEERQCLPPPRGSCQLLDLLLTLAQLAEDHFVATDAVAPAALAWWTGGVADLAQERVEHQTQLLNELRAQVDLARTLEGSTDGIAPSMTALSELQEKLATLYRVSHFAWRATLHA